MINNEGHECRRDTFYWKEKVAKATKELMQNISEHLRDGRYDEFFGGDNQMKINSFIIDITEALGSLRSWTSKQSERVTDDLFEALNRWWHNYWRGTARSSHIDASLKLLQITLQPIV